MYGVNEEKSKLANICIENWRDKLSDYELIEINEKTPKWFDFDYEYENCLWFKTLYDHGGIYLDTDVTVYKDFGPLLNNKMFVGNCLNNIPEMAIFGAQKNHCALKLMNEFYQDEIWKSSNYIITQLFTNILKNYYNIVPNLKENIITDEIVLYMPEYFNPYHFSVEFNHDCITKNTYTVHWMSASWHSRKNLFFLTNKHRIPLKTLLKQLEFVEKTDKNANEKTKLT